MLFIVVCVKMLQNYNIFLKYANILLKKFFVGDYLFKTHA